MINDKSNLTPEQLAAVTYRGGALLVSAAAGSGKTKVLTERLLSHIEDGDDLSEFLVITYTRAAAAELRTRIYDGIMERLSYTPDNPRLRRQSLLCRGASIDTIHGFCSDILRENAHLSKLPPDFRVADTSESEMIKAEVLDVVLSSAYESMETLEGFKELIDTVSPGRDDRKVTEIVLDAHEKLRSHPYPSKWAAEQIENLSLNGIADASETAWGAHLMEKARETVGFWIKEMASARREMRPMIDLDKAYGECFDASIADLEAFEPALCKSWDEARRHSMIDFSRIKPKPLSGHDDIKDVRGRCRAAIRKIAAVFEYTSEEYIEDMRAVAPAMAALLRLTMEFDGAYHKEKTRRGLVDFSDLEHLTLHLLIDGETGEKTGLAATVSQRFKEIMVDEYQDVNAVQEMIFNAVSQDSGNIFMVGDVKQSIYRFRLADPTIFLEKYRTFRELEDMPKGRAVGEATGEAGGEAAGVKIHLSRNFRSQAGILDAVNFIFGNIMSAEFGEIDYSDRERLIPGREDDDPRPSVEFDVIDMRDVESGGDELAPAKTQVEARFIAKRIAELVDGGYTIPDGQGGRRCIEYSDIVILLRSLQGKAWQYAAALRESLIPVDMPGKEGFFDSVEISSALSILSVIDNPMQDVPLAAALSGPAYGFTASELAVIRSASRNGDFYSALVETAKNEDTDASEKGENGVGLREKCTAFLDDMESLRVVMPDMPADRFIWRVYNKTGLTARIGAMRGGNRRRNNLTLLAEYARAYEQNGYKGLFSFLSFIRALKERGAEIPQENAAPYGSADENTVRIMSIHKSKGLEFPVVFLADMSKQFNNTDSQKPLVMHPKLGVGPKRADLARRIEYTTLARMAVQSKLTKEMLAEELRLLYVAMTRAKENLIITAAFDDAENEMDKLAKLSRSGICPQVLEEIKSMSGWILLPLIHATKTTDRRNWDFRTIDAPQVMTSYSEPTAEVKSSAIGKLPEVNPEDVVLLHKRFSFVYPHKNAPELPSKLTVTELKGRHYDATISEDASRVFQTERYVPEETQRGGSRAEQKVCPHVHSVPAFVAEKTGLNAAQRGTALHQAMQHVDFAECGDAASLGEELDAIVDKGFLTGEQRAVIDEQKIMRFFATDVGRRILGAGKVYREFKFSLLYPAERFFPEGGDDEILIQGVVDCFFEEEGELTVVDFKTDYVTTETLGEKAEFYTPQIAAYSEALERITGKRVKERVLYFFGADKCVFC